MSGVNDYADKRIEANDKLIAEWLRSKLKPSVLRLHAGEMTAQEVRAVQGFINYFSGTIERGEYRTKETQNEQVC